MCFWIEGSSPAIVRGKKGYWVTFLVHEEGNQRDLLKIVLHRECLQVKPYPPWLQNPEPNFEMK